MKNSFNAWLDVNVYNLNQVVDLVLTNGTYETIKSDIWLTELMGEKDKSLSILDFGCGIGRNIFVLKQGFPYFSIHGCQLTRFL